MRATIQRHPVARGLAQAGQIVVDLVILSGAYWLAFLFRFEFDLSRAYNLLLPTWPYVTIFQYAVLAMFVVAAILTPPDWVSQIFLALPMVALYLLGVGVAFLFGGARKREGAKSEQSEA